MGEIKLTPKQKRFCEEYLVDLNATQAYKRAGYSVQSDAAAAVEGHKLLKTSKVATHVQELMDARSKRTEITADRVLKEFAAIGFSKITDYLKVSLEEHQVQIFTPGKDDEDEDENDEPDTETRYYKLVEIFETEKIPPEAIAAISSIKQGRNGIELKLHDKVKALENMGRHLGMFNDRMELTGKGGKPLIPSDATVKVTLKL